MKIPTVYILAVRDLCTWRRVILARQKRVGLFCDLTCCISPLRKVGALAHGWLLLSMAVEHVETTVSK